MAILTRSNLIIGKFGDTWAAVIANTNVRWTFAGADSAAQYESVKALANAMKGGLPDLMPELVHIFTDIGNPAMSYAQMFGSTNGLFLNEIMVVDVFDEAKTLGDVLEDAGIDLLGFL